MNERLYKELSKNSESSYPVRGTVVILILCIIVSTIVCYIGYRNTGKLSHTLPQAIAVSVLAPLLYYLVSQNQNKFLDSVKNGDYTLTVWVIEDKWTDKFHCGRYVDGERITKREVNRWLRLKNEDSIIEIKFNRPDWKEVNVGDKLTEVSNNIGVEYIIGDFTEYINNQKEDK